MRAVVGSANLAALRLKMMTHARGAGPLVRPPRIASLHVTFMFEIMSIWASAHLFISAFGIITKHDFIIMRLHGQFNL